MPRVVLDTNVIVSGTLVDGGYAAKVLDAWRAGSFTLVISEAIIQEVKEVLNDPKLCAAYGLSRAKIGRLINLLRRYSVVVPGELDLAVVERDPDDDKVIIAAVEGQARYIVSGDTDLVALKSYRGMRILTPKEFVREVLLW